MAPLASRHRANQSCFLHSLWLSRPPASPAGWRWWTHRSSCAGNAGKHWAQHSSKSFFAEAERQLEPAGPLSRAPRTRLLCSASPWSTLRVTDELFPFSFLNYQLLGMWDGSEHKGRLSPISRTHRVEGENWILGHPLPFTRASSWNTHSPQHKDTGFFICFLLSVADCAKCQDESRHIVHHQLDHHFPRDQMDCYHSLTKKKKSKFNNWAVRIQSFSLEGPGALGSCRVSSWNQWPQSCARGRTGDNLCPQRATVLTLMWKEVFSYPCRVTGWFAHDLRPLTNSDK